MIEVFCDGASRGQGTVKLGEAAAAVVICRNNKEIGQMARGLGKRTNNEAEYEAVILGLIICAAGDLKDPMIYSDSTLVVNQILGNWECRPEELHPYLYTVYDIQESFRFRIKHVPRKIVSRADFLANQFLDSLPSQQGKRSNRKKRNKTAYHQTTLQLVKTTSEEAQFIIPAWDPQAIVGIPLKELPEPMRNLTHVVAWVNLAAVDASDLRIAGFESVSSNGAG